MANFLTNFANWRITTSYSPIDETTNWQKCGLAMRFNTSYLIKTSHENLEVFSYFPRKQQKMRYLEKCSFDH